MDPNATLRLIVEYVEDGEYAQALDSISSLQMWISRGGAVPNALILHVGIPSGSPAAHCIAKAWLMEVRRQVETAKNLHVLMSMVADAIVAIDAGEI